MSILVFGENGQVARELGRQADVKALGRKDVDLMRPERARDAIESVAPKAVINAAAWTAVDQAEDHEDAALALNAEAPRVMAETCARRDIPFLHVSTDYVFDGTGNHPWKETDPVAPLGVYGRTKLAGERAIQAASDHHAIQHWAILRTAWVFSAHGQNFVKTILRLSETHDRLTIVADQVGGPTPASDIAAALLKMTHYMCDGHPGGLYHFSGQPAVSWADFARTIFVHAGREVDVIDIPSSDYPTPAARPLNSRLDCSAITRDFGITPPDWRVGLDAVLKELDA